MKFICNVCTWMLALLTQLSSNLSATTADPHTEVKVFIAERWNSDHCSEAIYDGTLESLFLPTLLGGKIINFLMTTETAPEIIDPAGNRLALKITALGDTQITSSLRIEGMRWIVENIQRKLASGEAIKITEFQKCVQNNPSIDLVQLVNFDQFGRKIFVNLESKIELIRKENNGVCGTFRKNSLAEIIHMYLPNLDLASLEARVSMSTDGVISSGELATKNVVITFYKDFQSVLEMTIGTRSEMSYDVLKKLEVSSGLLQLTSFKDCFHPEVGMLWASTFRIRKL